MITQKPDGTLYCTRCKRDCDSACYTSCKYYRGYCTACKHWNDADDYCDDCDSNLADGRTDMSTETVIVFICGMFAGVLMEFIIATVVIMKGETK